MVKKTDKVKSSNISLRDKFEAISESSSKKASSSNKRTSKTKTKRIKKNTAVSKVFKIIGMILLPIYLRNSWIELKQVTWPNFKLSRQLTVAVIIFAVFFGVSIALVDAGLSRVFKVILLK